MGLRKGLKGAIKGAAKPIREVGRGTGHVVHAAANHVVKPVVQEVVKPVVQGVVKPVVEEVVKPVVQEVVKPVVQAVVMQGILPAVPGAGRKKTTTSHVVTDFQSESITLVVTANGEVEIEEVASPCEEGHHNIVDCEQPLEIQLNDGSYIFNDKFCTNCGVHFPFLQSEAQGAAEITS